MAKKRILVLASGDEKGGGSGFQELVEFSRTQPPILDADIVCVASNHATGGVFNRAQKLDIRFRHFPKPFTADRYKGLVRAFVVDFTMCSGWLFPVRGLDPRTTINIHPGLLPGDGSAGEFGGKGMWGHYVHEAVMNAHYKGRVTQSGLTMHFVTDYDEAGNEGYDRGPIIFQLPVLIRPDDTPKTLAARVNEKERAWQSHILNLVVQGYIRLAKVKDEWIVECQNPFQKFVIPGLI